MPEWRKSFFQVRIERLPEDKALSFDATEIASEAEDLSCVHYGKGDEESALKQSPWLKFFIEPGQPVVAPLVHDL